MTNVNYNLLKFLHNTLDDLWRLEKFYVKDAEEENCAKCKEILESIKADVERHIGMLKEELVNHVKEEKFG